MICIKKWSVGLALLTFAGVASAIPTYEYSDDNPYLGGHLNGEQLLNINSSFDANNTQFSWEYTISGNNSDNDGFWLVVNDGSNPKGNENLAILYGDLANDTLTAYKYDGNNGYGSYNQPNALLDSWTGVFTTQNGTGNKTVSFDIDVNTVNSALGGGWQGISYTDSIGIWFHPTVNSNFTYNQTGGIQSFTPGSSGWHDVGNQATIASAVSAPSVFLLLFAGLSGLVVATKRRRKAEGVVG